MGALRRSDERPLTHDLYVQGLNPRGFLVQDGCRYRLRILHGYAQFGISVRMFMIAMVWPSTPDETNFSLFSIVTSSNKLSMNFV